MLCSITYIYMFAVLVFAMNRIITIMMTKMAVMKIIRKASVIVPFKVMVVVIAMIIVTTTFSDSHTNLF